MTDVPNMRDFYHFLLWLGLMVVLGALGDTLKQILGKMK